MSLFEALWEPQTLRHRLAQQFIIWTLFGLYLSLAAIGENRYGNNPVWMVWYGEMSGAYCAGLLAPLIKRFTLSTFVFHKVFWQQLLVHFLMTPVITVFAIVMLDILRYPLFSQMPGYFWFWSDFAERYYREWPRIGVVYCIIAMVIYGRHRFRLQSQRLMQAKELEAQLAHLRLMNLKSQLQPHFLFNTLNMISEFIHSDANRADELLNKLSELLRHYLQTAECSSITMSEELKLLNVYLDIMQQRFPAMLDWHTHITCDLEACRVPPMLLQPLIENAIKHSQASRGKVCRLSLDVSLNQNGYIIKVTDNNTGSDEVSSGHGIGLKNCQEQLRCLYGDKADFQFRRNDNGSQVVINVPIM